MPKIIDNRNGDGDIVFLGKSLTLPSDATTGGVGFNGSLRYNNQTHGIEAYTPVLVSSSFVYSWHELCFTENVYADIAERYHADDFYEPGTVLIIGGANEVTVTDIPYHNCVAGIVSTQPSYKMNSYVGNDQTHPYIALKGRVPCKVIGNVKKGDFIVTSHVPGHGQASSDKIEIGMMVGISLTDFIGDVGIIEVKV